ncbi:MAG: hypothetical protein WA012_13735 [Rhodoferax sp.]
MTPGCMDCRALACPEFIEGLAVTMSLFMVRVCGIGPGTGARGDGVTNLP